MKAKGFGSRGKMKKLARSLPASRRFDRLLRNATLLQGPHAWQPEYIFLFASRDSLPFTWEARKVAGVGVVISTKYLSHSLLGSFLEFFGILFLFRNFIFFFNFLNSNSTTYIHIHTYTCSDFPLALDLPTYLSLTYCVALDIDCYRACGGEAQTGLQSRFFIFTLSRHPTAFSFLGNSIHTLHTYPTIGLGRCSSYCIFCFCPRAPLPLQRYSSDV